MHTHIKHNVQNHASLTPFTPLNLAKIYNFPEGDGTGVTIGIVELGGGYFPADVTNYLQSLGITTKPNITDVSIDGANNTTGSDSDIEVALDMQIIASLVPNANIRMYFAPNTNQGFLNAIQQAITDGCKLVSISWGGPENQWDSADLTSFNALFEQGTAQGCNFYVSCGDNGSSDGESGVNVDFPGSSPFVVSCGGTQLMASSNNVRTSEVVWDISSNDATGGGKSSVFPKPTYQSAISLSTNRMVPDLSANASPNSGYQILYNGQQQIVGGTSAVSPLMTALFSRILQTTKTLPFVSPIFYQHPEVFFDVTQGNNGAYQATSGFDLCTGNGVCDGTKMMSLFTSQPSPPPIVPTPPIVPPTPTPTLPKANFTVSQETGIVPLSVTFTNTSTNANSYVWHFGDGGASVDANPTYVYKHAGRYSPSLTAIAGTTHNTLVQPDLITVTSTHLVASFTYTVAGNTVTFTNTSLGSPTSYTWYFGDLHMTTVQNPSHTYTHAGKYEVILIAKTGMMMNVCIKEITI